MNAIEPQRRSQAEDLAERVFAVVSIPLSAGLLSYKSRFFCDTTQKRNERFWSTLTLYILGKKEVNP